jgi:hypothetical protein
VSLKYAVPFNYGWIRLFFKLFLLRDLLLFALV